ncbi:MAG: hypothetical protein BWY98_01173 [Tenericutes bacterium ADurb.BinA155]|nr:MAG: hypothetical protein BWY98_01173 [Tenericutes bacterium ADurb.BinA155]
MNKSTFFILPAAAMLLAACGTQTSSVSSKASSTSEGPSSKEASSSSSVDPYTFKTISPAGAPTLAYYDQGGNADFVTDTTPTNVAGQFKTNTYDAIVFDSINALKQIKANSYPFKLSNFITGGNFYVVSYGKDAAAVPTASDTFASFSENGLPDLVFKKLLASYSGYNTWAMPTVTYLPGVSDVLTALVSHTYDYYFIAQPALFAAKAKLGADASKVNVVANVRNDWKSYSGQTSIPQAALFLRTTSVEAHTNVAAAYTYNLNQRIKNSITDPAKVKASIETYSADATVQAAKFGYSAAVAYNVQKDGANGFGMVDPDSIEDNHDFVNTFIEKLGNAAYTAFDDSLFY